MNTELLMFLLKIHEGQLRLGNRDDGKPDPQFEHIFRVFCALLSPCPHYPKALLLVRANAAPLMLDVALAHDSLEDADDPKTARATLERLLHPYAFQAVEALTRQTGEGEAEDAPTYFEYIEKQILPNPLASLVKLADIEDNIRNARPSLQDRYNKAKDMIMRHWEKAIFPPMKEPDSAIIGPGGKPANAPSQIIS